MSVPNIELMLPPEAVASVVNGFLAAGMTPLAASLYVASVPFKFDGDPNTGRYTVKNLASGKIIENYLGATIETRIADDGDFIFYMDNGDILNISDTQRKLGFAVHQRMTLISDGKWIYE